MPMGEFKDFQDCVNKNKDKENPKGYCAEMMRKIEGKKSFSFDSQKMEIKSDGKNYYFEGYLENFEEDSVKDICTLDCLSDMAEQLNLGMKGFVAFTKGDMDHDTTIENNPFKTPISKIVEAKVDTKGLYVKGMFNPDHTDFTANVRQAENGFLDGLSITYKVKEFTPRKEGGRILNKVQLKGYAHTPRPVCNKCRLTNIFAKSLNFIEEVKTMMMSDDEMESVMSKMSVDDMKKMMEKMKNKMDIGMNDNMNKKSEGDIVEEQKSEKVEVNASEKVESKSEEKNDIIFEEMKSKISELEKKIEMKSGVSKDEIKSIVKEFLKEAPVENKSLVQDEQKGESAESPITLKGVLGIK